MKQFDSAHVFGVLVNPMTMDDAMTWVEDVVHAEQLHHVVTPNTEMIVQARRDHAIRKALNAAQLHLPDSVGVVWALKSLYKKQSARVTGADFSYSLCELANQRHQTVGLIGRQDGLYPHSAAQAAQKLRTKYPNAHFKSFVKAPNEIAGSGEFDDIDFLLVGLGAPAQDIWIEQHRALLKKSGVKIAAGVGASIDFMAEAQKRAPATFQKLKLEWLWRLIKQPSRITRQLALPYFVWLVILAKLGIIEK